MAEMVKFNVIGRSQIWLEWGHVWVFMIVTLAVFGVSLFPVSLKPALIFPGQVCGLLGSPLVSCAVGYQF